jgi:hypothetical protein
MIMTMTTVAAVAAAATFLSVAVLFLQQELKPAFSYLLHTRHIHTSQNLKSV